MTTSPTSPRRFFKELRFQQLRALVEVSRLKSFAAAAAELDLATPSVWQQVRGLEAEFGVELVRIDGKNVELTEDGQVLVDAARPIVEGFDSLHDIFAHRTRSAPKRLVLASTIQLLKHELGKPLAEFRRRHPEVQLSIIDRSSQGARACLENGEADMAIAGQFDIEPLAAITTTRLTAYPFMLMAPTGHRLLSASRVSIKTIAQQPLVLPSAAANCRSKLDECFRNAGVLHALNVVVDASNFDLLVDHVIGGFGICVMSVSPAILKKAEKGDRSLRGIGFRNITRLFGEETIVLLQRTGRFEPPHHTAFRELVEAATKAG